MRSTRPKCATVPRPWPSTPEPCASSTMTSAPAASAISTIRGRDAHDRHALVEREPLLELVDEAHTDGHVARAPAAHAVALDGPYRGRPHARVVSQAEVVVRREINGDGGRGDDRRTCGLPRHLPFGRHRPNCAMRTIGTL